MTSDPTTGRVRYYSEPGEHPLLIRLVGASPEAWNVTTRSWVRRPHLVGKISGAGGDGPWHEISPERSRGTIAPLRSPTQRASPR